MKNMLIAVNLVLLALIVWAAFFWQPDVDQTPLPGTHEARLGQHVPVSVPVAPSGGGFTLDGAQGPVVRQNSPIPSQDPIRRSSDE